MEIKPGKYRTRPRCGEAGHKEEWKMVPGWANHKVSCCGVVIRVGIRGIDKDSLKYPKKINTHKTKPGYHRVILRTYPLGGTRSIEQKVFLHRVVALAFVEGDKSLCVAHLDGNKDNNCRENLAWVTHKENESHKKAHGTVRHGHRNNKSKINERMAIAIKDLYEIDKIKQTTLAERFGLSKANINLIIRGKAWSGAIEEYKNSGGNK